MYIRIVIQIQILFVEHFRDNFCDNFLFQLSSQNKSEREREVFPQMHKLEWKLMGSGWLEITFRMYFWKGNDSWERENDRKINKISEIFPKINLRKWHYHVCVLWVCFSNFIYFSWERVGERNTSSEIKSVLYSFDVFHTWQWYLCSFLLFRWLKFRIALKMLVKLRGIHGLR